MKTFPLAIYGGETTHDGTRCGIETRRRIMYVYKFLKCHKFPPMYFAFGAGILQSQPQYPQLKFVMKAYSEKLLPQYPTVCAEKDGWGTFRESIALYTILKERNETEVYLCSSWYHIPRILLIWWIISRGKIKIYPLWAPSPKLSSILSELLSFGKVFVDWFKLRKEL